VPLLMSAFTPKANIGPRLLHVRSGSKPDMCGAKLHVRFTPESGHDQTLDDRNFVSCVTPRSRPRAVMVLSSLGFYESRNVKHRCLDRLGSRPLPCGGSVLPKLEITTYYHIAFRFLCVPTRELTQISGGQWRTSTNHLLSSWRDLISHRAADVAL
jgi:hypothetical protein